MGRSTDQVDTGGRKVFVIGKGPCFVRSRLSGAPHTNVPTLSPLPTPPSRRRRGVGFTPLKSSCNDMEYLEPEIPVVSLEAENAALKEELASIKEREAALRAEMSALRASSGGASSAGVDDGNAKWRKIAEKVLGSSSIVNFQELAQLPDVPNEILAEHATALKAAQGPAHFEHETAQAQHQEAVHSHRRMSSVVDPLFRSRVAYRRDSLAARVKIAEKAVTSASFAYKVCRRELMSTVAQRLIKVMQEYDEAVAVYPTAEMHAVADAFSEAVETGAVKAGSDVEFDDRARNRCVRARVISVPADLPADPDSMYLIQLYQATENLGEKFSTGLVGDPIRVKRLRLSNCSSGVTQPLEGKLIPGSIGTEPSPFSPKYLVGLMASAEQSVPMMRRMLLATLQDVGKALGAEVSSDGLAVAGVKLVIGPLKKLNRVCQKAAEKYEGNYSRVLDILRATIVCTTPAEIRAVLRALPALGALCRGKNRLHPCFDAQAQGGYRDILLNLRVLETGHICELQVSLLSLVDIKGSHGHADYRITRTVGGLEPGSTSVLGMLSAEHAEQIQSGVINTVNIEGTEVNPKLLAQTLESPKCRICSLYISSATGLKETKIEMLFSEMAINQVANTIVRIRAGGCGMGGSLPPGLIQRCRHLTELVLSCNNISGTFSAAIGEFDESVGFESSLQCLLLFQNQLSGEIPENIAALTALEELDISGNELDGRIPASIGKLSRLRVLKASDNWFEGGIPKEVVFCKQLTHLDLANHENGFRGTQIPSNIGELAMLEELRLSTNGFVGRIPSSLGECHALRKLSLRANCLTGEIPVSLSKCSFLVRLFLNDNSLTGSVPAEFGLLVALEKLYLDGNELTGELPKELGNCKKLTNLRLHHNQLTGAIPSELGSCTHLREINLSHNRFFGEIPGNLGCCTLLHTLILSENQLNGSIPPDLGHCTDLKHLDLRGNTQVTSFLPPELGYLDALVDVVHANEMRSESKSVTYEKKYSELWRRRKSSAMHHNM